MKAGKYNIKDLFSNRYIQQIVIPEIQRDYVWGKDHVIGLMNSIVEDFQKYSSRPDILKDVGLDDPDIKNAFNEFYRKRKYASNIGFIYAYNDEQYPGKYFLIDGQQRITTIFFMLMVLGTKNENLKNKYQSTYTIDGELKLDYRVRESAHEFAKEFVTYSLAGNDDFKNSNVYFDNKYDNDKTVCSILKNVDVMNGFVDSLQDIDTEALYVYIEELVDFWYFDTNASEQGEELYIYMNARGEQTQGNENIKADLLGRLPSKELKNSYGTKWEEWQDYFWRKRGKNPNADKGFNQFLCCISGLEHYLKGDKSKFYSKKLFNKHGEVETKDIISVIDLELIEGYFNALIYLFEYQEEFCSSRQYSDWVPKALESFWSLLNDSTINWFADYSDDDRATERRGMVYLWSVLHFIKTRQKSVLQRNEVFRLLRIYYLRFNNNIRAVSSIRAEVELQVESGIWKESGDPDEKLKFNLLETCEVQERDVLEELIWQIEDHPFNLNGRDVGNTNLSHLIDNNKEITIDYLTSIRDKFNELFPENDTNLNKIKHLLLYYGNYFDRISPYYYMNFKFNNWRRIVRGLSTELEEEDNPFYNLFSDFISFNGSLDKFIIKKDNENLLKENCSLFREKILWYSRNVGDKIWNEGHNIAFSLGNPCNFPDWKNKDKVFLTDYKYYNIKGNLQGGKPKELFELLKKKNA
jgi:uncharacterized protein with ParB-like and HNH nuclease domain